MEDWDLLRQIQEIDFNTSEYEDMCKKVDKVDKESKECSKEDSTNKKESTEDVPPTLAELRRLAKFSPNHRVRAR